MTPIKEHISFTDLITILDDPILRQLDTTAYISHDANLHFTFEFHGQKQQHKVIHHFRSHKYPLLRLFCDELNLLEDKAILVKPK
jgi:hypothetical protein